MKHAFLLGAAFLSLAASAFAEGDPAELIIEAYVDGPSTLHLTKDGIFWVNGAHNKPGRWSGADEPTYINGIAWKPVWQNPKPNGPDRSDLFPLKWGSVDVMYQLVSIRQNRGESGIDDRTQVSAKREGDDFVVIIPDPEPGPRWYKFILRKKHAVAMR